LFFIGAALGRLWHLALPSTNEVMLMAGLMVAINTGVTKTPLGSTLVVTEMAGLPLLPTTIIAAVVSLLLTSEVRLIHTQRRRSTASPHFDTKNPVH
jgi:H+/Cl- antiporter ClcA